MNNNKNIERFFQEKFKDFEANPAPAAWDNIAAQLKKKKNKRIIPIWFTIGGIAASLIIGYFIFNNFSGKSNIEVENTVVNSEKNNSEPTISDKNVIVQEKSIEKIVAPKIENETNKVAESDGKSLENSNDLRTNNEKVAVISNKNETAVVAISQNKLQNGVATSNNNVAVVNSYTNKSKKKYLNKNEPAFAGTNKNKKLESEENAPSDQLYNKEENKTAQNTTIAAPATPNSDFEKVADSKTTENKVDENKIAVIENPLNKILAEKEKEKEKTPKQIASNTEKWKIRPNAAPIFMNASGGSPIHDIFSDNKKDYDNKLSIGVGADYAVTKKWSIRAGVNKFDMSYNTKEVSYYSDLAAVNGISPSNSIQTIALKDEFHNIVIGDKKARGAAVVTPPNQTVEETGYLKQKFGYIEIPVEVSYKILDKKFGITVISGVSTLLLNNNEVSIVSDNKTLVLGDVNNLSKIHYSTNFGLGFKYSFWKSFEANVEPTFKYQINSFTENSGGFNPYILGIYSGISYRL